MARAAGCDSSGGTRTTTRSGRRVGPRRGVEGAGWASLGSLKHGSTQLSAASERVGGRLRWVRRRRRRRRCPRPTRSRRSTAPPPEQALDCCMESDEQKVRPRPRPVHPRALAHSRLLLIAARPPVESSRRSLPRPPGLAARKVGRHPRLLARPAPLQLGRPWSRTRPRRASSRWGTFGQRTQPSTAPGPRRRRQCPRARPPRPQALGPRRHVPARRPPLRSVSSLSSPPSSRKPRRLDPLFVHLQPSRPSTSSKRRPTRSTTSRATPPASSRPSSTSRARSTPPSRPPTPTLARACGPKRRARSSPGPRSSASLSCPTTGSSSSRPASSCRRPTVETTPTRTVRSPSRSRSRQRTTSPCTCARRCSASSTSTCAYRPRRRPRPLPPPLLLPPRLPLFRPSPSPSTRTSRRPPLSPPRSPSFSPRPPPPLRPPLVPPPPPRASAAPTSPSPTTSPSRPATPSPTTSRSSSPRSRAAAAAAAGRCSRPSRRTRLSARGRGGGPRRRPGSRHKGKGRVSAREEVRLGGEDAAGGEEEREEAAGPAEAVEPGGEAERVAQEQRRVQAMLQSRCTCPERRARASSSALPPSLDGARFRRGTRSAHTVPGSRASMYGLV